MRARYATRHGCPASNPRYLRCGKPATHLWQNVMYCERHYQLMERNQRVSDRQRRPFERTAR